MIFRLSQKLNAKVKAGTLMARPLDESPFADWTAHLFTANRTQYILVSNTKSLYSTVMTGKGITNNGQFLNRALNSIREFTQDDCQQFAYLRLIAPASKTVTFAKALNRSVTGSMNELVFLAVVWLTETTLSTHDISHKLNDVPMSSLQGLDGKPYGSPREAFTKLLVTAPAP